MEISREDFPILRTRNKYFEDTLETETKDINMSIFKVDFDTKKHGKWDLLYNGMKVHASIKDDNFYKQINEGKRFGKGDSLYVTLKITKEYDKQLNAMIDKQYEITQVHKVILREEQENLFSG